MLIYRIEDLAGGGLYRGDNSFANPVGSTSCDRHPLPDDDSRLMDSIRYRMDIDLTDENSWYDWCRFLEEDFIFGFASVDQLRNWVYQDEWLVKLDEVGFQLSVYEVPENHICIGNTQAVFRRNQAVSTRHYTMTQFFNL